MHDHELIEAEWHTMPHITPTEKLVITSEVVNIGNRYGHKLASISMTSKHVRIHDSTFNFTVNAISDPRTAIMGELRMVMLAKGFTPTDNSHLRLRIVNEGFNVDDTWFRVFGITLIISIILFWVFIGLLVDKYLL